MSQFIRNLSTLFVACYFPAVLVAQPPAKPGVTKSASASAKTVRSMSKDSQIKSALAAAPAHIAKSAKVMSMDESGKMIELRNGSNGWTCMPDQPNTPGQDPMCLDEEGMKWVGSLMAHAAKPANTAPGMIYMLAGGSDISATDPWATKTDHFVSSPPHWMLLWPVDGTKSGLATTPKKTGTWIMWAGTPYAHLMINQKP